MLQRHSANAEDPMYDGERAVTDERVMITRRTLENCVGSLSLSMGEIKMFD